jgi:hypothetical protein
MYVCFQWKLSLCISIASILWHPKYVYLSYAYLSLDVQGWHEHICLCDKLDKLIMDSYAHIIMDLFEVNEINGQSMAIQLE